MYICMYLFPYLHMYNTNSMCSRGDVRSVRKYISAAIADLAQSDGSESLTK